MKQLQERTNENCKQKDYNFSTFVQEMLGCSKRENAWKQRCSIHPTSVKRLVLYILCQGLIEKKKQILVMDTFCCLDYKPITVVPGILKA